MHNLEQQQQPETTPKKKRTTKFFMFVALAIAVTIIFVITSFSLLFHKYQSLMHSTRTHRYFNFHNNKNNNDDGNSEGETNGKTSSSSSSTQQRQGDLLTSWQHTLLYKLRRALVKNNEAYDRGQIEFDPENKNKEQVENLKLLSQIGNNNIVGGDGNKNEISDDENNNNNGEDTSNSGSDSSSSSSSSSSGSENNMKKKNKKTLPTFLQNPPKTIKRLSKVTTSDYIKAVMTSEPLIFEKDVVKCTKNQWNLDFIKKYAADDIVDVETTKSNIFYANEGLHKEAMTIGQYLELFQSPHRKQDYYLAEQSMERTPRLKQDVVEPFFSEDFDLDKLQMWIGPGKQIAPLHHDQWDNILCQLSGERQIMLFDPFQVDRLYPKEKDSRHFSQVNPFNVDFKKFPKFKNAVSLNVTLKAGEVMFLPSCWWHTVKGGEKMNIAVNFWYLPNKMTEMLYDLMLPPGDNY